MTFSLIGACTDPDTVLGQVLNYTWWWNGTHLIGYGSSLTWNFTEPGTYVITLNVTDGEFSKETSVEVTIEPKDIPGPPLPPDGDDGDEGGIGTIAVIGMLVVLIVIGGVIFFVMSKRREEAKEAEEEAQEKREAIKHMAEEVKATAHEMEREVKEARTAAPKPPEVTKVVIETRGADGQVVVSSTGNFANSGNYYVFAVGGDGWYGIGKKMTSLLSWLKEGVDTSGAVHTGNAPNTVRGDCAQGELTLWVNGTKLATVKDSSFYSGMAGLAVGNRKGPVTEVVFEEFSVYIPQE